MVLEEGSTKPTTTPDTLPKTGSVASKVDLGAREVAEMSLVASEEGCAGNVFLPCEMLFKDTMSMNREKVDLAAEDKTKHHLGLGLLGYLREPQTTSRVDSPLVDRKPQTISKDVSSHADNTIQTNRVESPLSHRCQRKAKPKKQD